MGRKPVPMTIRRIMERTVLRPSGCIEWQGSKNGDGYAFVRFEGKTRKLSRLIWELNKGPIPEGLQILHQCDNRGCINISHLFLGTQKDNVRDCVNKGRNTTWPGETNWFAKLSKEQVSDIKEDTRKQQDIADDYGISQPNVSMIKHGHSWRHLP
jgi:hypothetical protein